MNTLSVMNCSSIDKSKKKSSKEKQFDDICLISENKLRDNLSAKITFVPLHTSTVKTPLKKPVESSKKLKKKLSEFTEENEKLKKEINDKNQEINELKSSVNSLNDVLGSSPLGQVRVDSSITTRKILELGKKNRQYRIELESKKLLINKRDVQIESLERKVQALNKKLKEYHSQTGGKSLHDLQAKLNGLKQKWFEARNKNAELQEKLKLAQKCLQQEIGVSFDLNKLNNLAAQNGGAHWRGRAQQILNLQQSNTELKTRIETLENIAKAITASNMCDSFDAISIQSVVINDAEYPLSNYNCGHSILRLKNTFSMKSGMSFEHLIPGIRKNEISQRPKVEKLENTINELRTEMDQQRKKMLSLKIRNKNLNKDVLEYKAKANSLEACGEYNSLNLATINEQILLQTRDYETRLEVINQELKEIVQRFDASKAHEVELEAKLKNASDQLAERDAQICSLQELNKKFELDMKALCGGFLFSCRELRKEEFVAILDSLETEKNFLSDQIKTLNERLNAERFKNENLNDLLGKQKLLNTSLENKTRSLEKALTSNVRKSKRLQSISECTNNLGSKSGSVISFAIDNTSRSSSSKVCVDENLEQINELKQKLELASEKILKLENHVTSLNAEKEQDAKCYKEALEKSKNTILETILSYRGEYERANGNSIKFDSDISKAQEA